MCSLPFFASARIARPFSSVCRILMTPANGGQRGGARRCARGSVIEVTQSQDGERATIATVTRGAILRFRRDSLAWEARPALQHERLEFDPKMIVFATYATFWAEPRKRAMPEAAARAAAGVAVAAARGPRRRRARASGPVPGSTRRAGDDDRRVCCGAHALSIRPALR